MTKPSLVPVTLTNAQLEGLCDLLERDYGDVLHSPSLQPVRDAILNLKSSRALISMAMVRKERLRRRYERRHPDVAIQ